jgi:hypothetical protein
MRRPVFCRIGFAAFCGSPQSRQKLVARDIKEDEQTANGRASALKLSPPLLR